MARLNFFLISEFFLNFSCEEKILPGYRTDHSLIELSLDFNEKEAKGGTFWKFNNTLLYNVDYVKEVKNLFKEIKLKYAALPYNRDKISDIDNEIFETTINPQLFLEMILLETRGLSIAFSSALKKKDFS